MLHAVSDTPCRIQRIIKKTRPAKQCAHFSPQPTLTSVLQAYPVNKCTRENAMVCTLPHNTKSYASARSKPSSAAEGAQVNKHSTFLNSHCTFSVDERNLNDLNDDCVYPALPLVNNAAHDPVTALTAQYIPSASTIA